MITNSDARQIRVLLSQAELELSQASNIADNAGDPKFAYDVDKVKVQIANLRDTLRLKMAQNHE